MRKNKERFIVKKFIYILALVGAATLGFGNGSDRYFESDGVDVQVLSNGRVDVSHKIKLNDDGFYLLDVQIANAGYEILTVDSIRITVPIAEQLTGDMEMLFGGSDMGRTPLLRQRIDERNKSSESSIFEMVQVSENKYLFAGSLSWRTFIPKLMLDDNAFVIWSDGEGKQIAPGDVVNYERIVLSRDSDWMDLLDRFGDAIAGENGITTVKDTSFKGWATWDYYGRLFTKEDIVGNMRELNAFASDANLIQIDGGWWTERGDYMSVRSGLPGGIKAIADRIRAEGKIPGLHFDGFRGDAASEVCRTHPEYFLHDQDGKLIVERNEKVDRVMNYTFFDYSHPGARAHIAECIRTMREEWGIRYFKVDFMRYGLEQDLKKNNPSVKRIKAHDPTLTGVERFRLGMQTIRDAIGEDNYFLGCSAVFGPCIGFVDGMRTGGDVHPRYEAFPQRSLANAGNYFLSGKVFNGDCDYLVFRAAEDEDDKVFKAAHKFDGDMTVNEAQMWADFNKLYGNCRLQSDNLMTLRDERKAIVRDVFDYPAMDETIPLDVWRRARNKDDGFELLLARSGEDIYLGVFNWSDKEKTYDLRGFGRGGELVLDARHSRVLKYTGNASFESLCEDLRIN